MARQTRPRYEEPQCVTLSSDEDDAEDAASESAALAAASAAVAAALDGQPEAKKSKPTPAAAQLPPLKAANGLAPRTYQRKTAVRFEKKNVLLVFSRKKSRRTRNLPQTPMFLEFLGSFSFQPRNTYFLAIDHFQGFSLNFQLTLKKLFCVNKKDLDVLEIYRKPPCFSNFLVLFLDFNLGILVS